MSLPLVGDRLQPLCKIGEGAACCRYLTMDTDGFACAKHSNLKGLLDARVAAGTMGAQGDNCDGLEPEPVPGLEVAA